MNARLNTRGPGAAEAISGDGTLVLAPSRRICCADAVAGRILATADALVAVGGRLVAVRPADDRRLQAAVDVLLGRTALAAGSPWMGLQIARRSGGTDYVLVLRRAALASEAARCAGGESEQRIVVVIHAFEARPLMPIGLLQESFGLTAAEARLAACVCSGCSPRQAAADLGVSLSTVRTHLRAIYRKTGTSGQVDLAWRIAALWTAASVASAGAAALKRTAGVASFMRMRRGNSHPEAQRTRLRPVSHGLTQ